MVIELSSSDREFFALVARAIFVNPFSDERRALDQRLSGDEAPLPGDYARLTFTPKVAARLAHLESEGARRISDFAAEDRDLIKYGWLFCIFHESIEWLDDLIRRQVPAGDEPLEEPLAGKALEELRRRGFNATESVRFLELFWQIRRAYYFIEQGLTGGSPSMRALRRTLWNNVFTHRIEIYDQSLWNRMEDFSTLLLGETGSGKGAAAAAIGRSGWIPFDTRTGRFAESFTRTFLSINLSQYPETLIESELFGHRKGAFTGAVSDYQGVFSRGSPHGALFLDEIGEVSVPVQIKLLQVLQERTFSPVGGHERLRFEGRVIAATNRPIEELRAAGAFRDDFFYRLCSDVIRVPPLRVRLAEMPGELDALVRMSVQRIAGNASDELENFVLETLTRDLPKDYLWPGNVRELEQAVRRVILTGAYAGDVSHPRPERAIDLARAMEAGGISARDLLAEYCRLLYDRFGSYEEAARRTGLDRRTARKYIETTRNSGNR